MTQDIIVHNMTPPRMIQDTVSRFFQQTAQSQGQEASSFRIIVQAQSTIAKRKHLV